MWVGEGGIVDSGKEVCDPVTVKVKAVVERKEAIWSDVLGELERIF